MLQITVNEDRVFGLEKTKDGWKMDDKELTPDLIKISANEYHLLLNHRSYRLQVVDRKDAKHFSIAVNGISYTVSARSAFDLLLHELGMDEATGGLAEDLKAPMPGLVLQVLVAEGEQVEKGSPLIVLEAMKMENVIKAQGSGTVGTIAVKARDAVEKNQVLITFS